MNYDGKPIKTLQLQDPMIQFFIYRFIQLPLKTNHLLAIYVMNELNKQNEDT